MSASTEKFLNLMEVCVDYLIAICQSKSIGDTQLAACYMELKTFSECNLCNETIERGKWEVQKEMIGWLFDGIDQKMQLPKEKN